MATLTVLYVMGSDPIPHRSGQLFVPIMDNSTMTGYVEGEDPPEQMTYRDAVALKADAPAPRQTVLFGVADVVESGRNDIAAALSDGAAVHADFFAMFDVPFAHGGAWQAPDDAGRARVAVISARAERTAVRRRRQHRPHDPHQPDRLHGRRRDGRMAPGPALLRPEQRPVRRRRAGLPSRSPRPETCAWATAAT
jgi:hypothetical protein